MIHTGVHACTHTHTHPFALPGNNHGAKLSHYIVSHRWCLTLGECLCQILGWPQVLRLRVNDTGAPKREHNRGHGQGDAEGLESGALSHVQVKWAFTPSPPSPSLLFLFCLLLSLFSESPLRAFSLHLIPSFP